jgi:CRISPR-associated endonuclease Csn1
MNLRDSEIALNIGLDMGTGSVGWSATDDEGALFHFKKQPTWGSRLFDSAETAASARIPRGQRRRYIRRRWRLNLLQRLFKEEVEKTDPEFFIRLRQSRLIVDDRGFKSPLFNDSEFSERDYYDKFPTIYHLRYWLMTTEEKADIRFIYLAAHNIVKHRGNFLRQENKSLSSKSANAEESVNDFYRNLVDWCNAHEGYVMGIKKCECKNLLEILSDVNKAPSQKRDDIAALLKVEVSEASSENKACNKALAAAMVGLKVEFKKVFVDLEAETTNMRLGDDEKVEALEAYISDEDASLFQSLKAVYSAYVLQGILSYIPGEPLSANMIAKYDKYGKDLKTLKALVKEYVPSEYDAFFRGVMYEDTNIYDASKAQGYTKYNLGVKKLGYDDFKKEVEKLFKGTGALDDARYLKMMKDFDEEKFLRRLKTSDNGSIPYQLHLEELHAILDNQSKYYPFLKTEQDKIESLVSFRIPYYVGPLQTKNAAVDHNGKQRFSWVERVPGKEGVPITPWNWEEVVDKSASAQKFIERMTGECTYLQGEDVLPRCSLLYEEFCVWNELNGAHFVMDGDKQHRFDAADREAIFELFKKQRTVRYKDVEALLESQLGYMNVHVSGGQGTSSFNSKLNSYRFFCYDVFGKNGEEFTHADYAMAEEIVLWSTLFEDRSIFEEKLKEKYGDRLTAAQIKTIKNKRFSGWGNLSRKFLTGVRARTDYGEKSIIDVLREGNPNAGSRNSAMVLMQVLRDEDLGFQKRIDGINEERYREIGRSLQVNELPGSPAIRRSINQAIRIVDEIVKIHGAPAKNIFIEVTRDDDLKKRGHRTATRFKQLEEATKKFKEEYAAEFKEGVYAQLKKNRSNLDDEKLMLYFAQHGKSLYSHRSLDINNLADCEVDHIIPRFYVKDDSIENKALVFKDENQAKTNELLIPKDVREKMSATWGMLHDAGLIGDKKYNNLMRDHIDDKAMKGFVARQLVETSQMVKLIQQLLKARYPETNVVAVKAGLSHELRFKAKLYKSREANDFHHAHDAYLACRMGLFVQHYYPKAYEEPIVMAHAMEKYLYELNRAKKDLSEKDFDDKLYRTPGSSGFFAESFSYWHPVDKETGEIWDGKVAIAEIRKALNYRQCFITRMPYEESGKFWDDTIYSPRGGKSSLLPLKECLDPMKYGGYSSQKFAYFYIYRTMDKRGNRQLRIGGVPISMVKGLNDGLSILAYAKQQATVNGLDFLELCRPRLLKNQLVEFDGSRYLVNGSEEMLNARQIALSQDDQAILVAAFDEKKDCDSGALDALFEKICHEGERLGKSIAPQLDNEAIALFRRLVVEDKINTIRSLLEWINGTKNNVDFSALGRSKTAGKIRPQRNGLKSELYVIDQSVTGMFERRTCIGL